MFENPRRGREARNFTTNVPKILDLKSSSEQIFFRKLSLGAPVRPVTITSHFDITFISLLKSRYNSEELKNFPLGTVMEMPKPPLPPAPYVPPQKQDSEESDGISLPVRCLFSPLKLIP